jgi:hypothetical protein
MDILIFGIRHRAEQGISTQVGRIEDLIFEVRTHRRASVAVRKRRTRAIASETKRATRFTGASERA